MSSPDRDSLSAFLSENFEAFSVFDAVVDRTVTQVGRDLDPSFHDFVLTQLVSTFVAGASSPQPVKTILVLDTNILFGDCRSVALGRPSSTERMFHSPALELWGPEELREELLEKIETELPEKASKPKARAHAKKLLSAIRLKAATELAAVRRARELIAGYDADDVPFLALALQVGAHAVVSRDTRSLGRQTEVPRWDIGGVAQVVGTAEGGSLALFVVGATAEALARAAEQVFVAVVAAINSALVLVANLIGAAVEGLAEILARIPPDVQSALALALVAAGIGVGLGMIFDKGFREAVLDAIGKVGAAVGRVVSWIIKAVSRLLRAVYAVLVCLWNVMLPITAGAVVAAGVLFRRISALIALLEERISD